MKTTIKIGHLKIGDLRTENLEITQDFSVEDVEDLLEISCSFATRVFGQNTIDKIKKALSVQVLENIKDIENMDKNIKDNQED